MKYIEKNEYPPRIKELNSDPIFQSIAPEEKELELVKFKLNWLKDIKFDINIIMNLLNKVNEHDAASVPKFTKSESKYVLQAFDINREGKIDAYNFLQFIDPDRINDRKQNCCWGTTCRITGLNHAYSLFMPSKRFLKSNVAKMMGLSKEFSPLETENNPMDMKSITGKLVIRESNGVKTAYVESSERKKRMEILRKLGLFFSNLNGDLLSPSNHLSNHSTSTVEKCDHCKWTMDFRNLNLQFLVDISREAFKEKKINHILTNGNPPHPPKLSTDPSVDADQNENSMLIQLLLTWNKGEVNDLVSFYSLEFGGKVTTNTSDIVYKEVYRDPPDADPDHQIQLKYLMKGLLPGCSYYFRIRALNGYGSSNFTYKIFTTVSSAPMRPMIVKLSSTSVTLAWSLTKNFYKRYKIFKSLFDQAKIDPVTGKIDSSENVRKENLIRVINERIMESQDLKKYVIKVARAAGIDTSHGFRSLFDLIDADKDDRITWEQYELFLISNNYVITSEDANAASFRSDNSNSSFSAIIQTNQSDLKYVIEKCTSEGINEPEIYEEILTTNSTEATIKHLIPGGSYRFRIYSINKNGISGPKSQSVIAHTHLETPSPPSLIAETIGTHSVTINWSDKYHKNARPSDNEATDKLIDEWAGRDLERDRGVNIEIAFRKLIGSNDYNTIDTSKLIYLFKYLNVDTSDHRLNDAIGYLDKSKTGSITFESFKQWWNNQKYIYSLRRSNEIYDSTFDELIDNTNSFRSVISPHRSQAVRRNSACGRLGHFKHAHCLQPAARAVGRL